MKQFGVLTSGGDTPGMNAAIRAIVKAGNAKGMRAFGVYHGYKGLIQGDIKLIDEDDVEGIAHKGGTILKTARSKEFMTDDGKNKALKALKAFELEGLIVIGGDGSIRGAGDICEMGINCICLPGTIDNDLNYTDYTIGFDTARNNVIGEIYKIRDTMISHDRIGVIEVMGNRCGDIALHAGVSCGVEAVLVPEKPFDFDKLCEQLSSRQIRGKMTSIIVVAEGIVKGVELADMLSKETGLEVKGVVLGYTQRGGDPSAFDRLLAIRMGVHAVNLLEAGKLNRTIGIQNDKIVDFDIKEALVMPNRFDDELFGIAEMLADN